jgi:sigma-B regulation protein RsbU (phosphoserine phosphatase)
MPGWAFAPQVAQLQPDTTVFLYTDGLNEAENAGHEQFEMERIRQVAETLPTSGLNTSETLVTQMAQAVAAFVGDAEQSDDLTMLAIRFLPGK